MTIRVATFVYSISFLVNQGINQPNDILTHTPHIPRNTLLQYYLLPEIIKKTHGEKIISQNIC